MPKGIFPLPLAVSRTLGRGWPVGETSPPFNSWPLLMQAHPHPQEHYHSNNGNILAEVTFTSTPCIWKCSWWGSAWSGQGLAHPEIGWGSSPAHITNCRGQCWNDLHCWRGMALEALVAFKLLSYDSGNLALNPYLAMRLNGWPGATQSPSLTTSQVCCEDGG